MAEKGNREDVGGEERFSDIEVLVVVIVVEEGISDIYIQDTASLFFIICFSIYLTALFFWIFFFFLISESTMAKHRASLYLCLRLYMDTSSAAPVHFTTSFSRI